MQNNHPAWNVIFLLDKISPSKIVMLKRAPSKKFAPNYYTGVGGKVEPGESYLQSAYRELEEETGIKHITLAEYARCIINNQESLHYFWGIYSKKKLPLSDDGTLEWVQINQVLKKHIIPTTLALCKQWSKRKFGTQDPFTLYLSEAGNIESVILVKLNRTEQGLAEI